MELQNSFVIRVTTNGTIFNVDRIAKDTFKVSNGPLGTSFHMSESEVVDKFLEGIWELYREQVRGFVQLYVDVLIPQRATKKSAGYDLRAYFTDREEEVINPGEMKTIPTGLTVYMQDDEFLDVRIRSGMARKYQLTLQNDAGVIDSDYYGNEIGIMIRNEGTEPFVIKHGDRIAQGIFLKYLVADDDKPLSEERTSGFGSTGVK